jgi:hypothetical protein
MARIPETFNIGDRSNITPERILELLEDMYIQLAEAINKKPEIYQRTTDGLTTDTFLANGDININTSTLNVEMLVEHTSTTAVVWQQLS